MDEGERIAQFVRELWEAQKKPHHIVDIYQVSGPFQRIWHVYYLLWLRTNEYLDTALVVYEDEGGFLHVGEECPVYVDEQVVALRQSLS